MIKNYIVSSIICIENLKTQKKLYIFDKTLALSIICGKCSRKDKEIFKKEKSIEILKILV